MVVACDSLVYLCTSELVDFYFYSQGISKRLWSSPVCLFNRSHFHLYVFMYACVHVCVYACVQACMHMCIYICVCARARFLSYLRLVYFGICTFFLSMFYCSVMMMMTMMIIIIIHILQYIICCCCVVTI
jgi:hypothetical protein